MKKTISRMIFSVLCIFLLAQSANAEQALIPVGQVIGIELADGSVTVAAFDDALGAGAKAAGLQLGDRITHIDGQAVSSANHVRKALERADGTVDLVLERNGRIKELELTPAVTPDGPRLGVYLKQGVTGVGTVTFFDPSSGVFGALGHGVNSSEGALLPMSEGKIYDASILSVEKGEAGDPGQLVGTLESTAPICTLSKNTPQGIFGTCPTGWEGEALPTAAAGEIHVGPAVIRSTVRGHQVQEYSVEILKIYPNDRQTGRNMLLKVTDPALLQATGGIVQGMGVSYNKDNLEKPLACKGFWCQSLFLLTSKIACIKRRYTWAESSEVCDRDGWTKSSERSLST